MGLLDSLNTDEARLGLGLLAAGGYSPTPMSFGQRIQSAMQGQDAYKQDALQKKHRTLQMTELEQQAQQRQAQQAWLAQQNPEPKLGLLGEAPAPVDPVRKMNYEAARLGAISIPEYISTLKPKETKYQTVGDNLLQIGADGVKPVFTAPPKAEGSPSAVREYEYAKGQGYGGTFEQWSTSQRKAGASSVSVNTGQKGFDNELKLRSDFRSEPVYKAHQEMTSAYGQIQKSLEQKSPAGDLAGATKIMKLLDPGSVVRESELGMAMQASGLMDRVTNYGNMVLSGQKLTPTQRADFQSLADKLYAESVKGYNSKRSEYGDIASQYKLNGPLITGKPAEMPTATAPATKPAMRWNPTTRKLDKVQ